MHLLKQGIEKIIHRSNKKKDEKYDKTNNIWFIPFLDMKISFKI